MTVVDTELRDMQSFLLSVALAEKLSGICWLSQWIGYALLEYIDDPGLLFFCCQDLHLLE
jgi:hypothetical protein